jgi:hypothetical protein
VTENEETEEAIAKIVLYYGGNILPKYALSRLKDQFDSRKSNLTKLIVKKRSEVIKDELGNVETANVVSMFVVQYEHRAKFGMKTRVYQKYG